MEKVNWSTVIWDLQKSGVSVHVIARKSGMSRTAIILLRDALRKQPLFSNGCRLLRLWQSHTKKPLSPVVQVVQGIYESFSNECN